MKKIIILVALGLTVVGCNSDKIRVCDSSAKDAITTKEVKAGNAKLILTDGVKDKTIKDKRIDEIVNELLKD